MADEARYLRQRLVPQVGENGQRGIQHGSVVIVGCGALGTVSADALARAGVGRIRIVDRDYVDLDNLQRQVLFDEDDAHRRLPKAVAAANRLAEVNSAIEIEPVVCDVNPRNVEELIRGFTVVLDGTDNMETRFLLNDACVKAGIPWVYGAAVGSTGMTMPIVPGRTACLRCLMETLPAPGTLPTCDTAGVLQSAASMTAHMQSVAAITLLAGAATVPWQFLTMEVWTAEFTTAEVRRKDDCLACVRRRFEFLSGDAVSWTTVLCGRDTVQILPPAEHAVPLESLVESLRDVGDVSYNGYLLTLRLPEYELTVFPTGRAMVNGTTDESLARALYARYVGA